MSYNSIAYRESAPSNVVTLSARTGFCRHEFLGQKLPVSENFLTKFSGLGEPR